MGDKKSISETSVIFKKIQHPTWQILHQRLFYIHQYIVDAFAVQTADENTKSIKINFGLIGLYLHIEKGFTGKQVQKAHMQLAKYKDKLPEIVLPENRGEITVFDVLQMPEGDKRDAEIEEWMQSVWDAYTESHKIVRDFLEKYLI